MATTNPTDPDRVIELMRKQLENMSIDEIDRKATEKRIIETELKRVQQATRTAAKSALNGDKMQAYKGVRMVKYKRIQGGNINILERKAGGIEIDSREYNRQGKRYRSERSRLTASYWGASRSFVMRIVQHGTIMRKAGTRYSDKGGKGNRGRIIARDFMNTTRSEMQVAADNIVRQLTFIDKLFMQE